MTATPPASTSAPLALGKVPEGATTVEEVVRARLAESVGGLRGSLEAAMPTVAFVVCWSLTKAVRPSLAAAAVVVVVALVARLVSRQSPRYALGSLVALAIAAAFALRSGRAEDAFLPGMIQTAAVGLVFAVTNLIRWPLFGFLIAAADPELSEATERLKASSKKGAPQDPESVAQAEADEAAVSELLTGWRRHEGVVRVASRVGWVIVVLDVIRLAVMVPLYLGGQVAALGVAKIALGWPAYLLAVLVIGLLLLKGSTPLDDPDARPAPA